MEIILYPTFIKVTDYELGMALKLEKYLSVWDKATFKYKFNAFIFNDEDNSIIFPAGINLQLLKSLLPEHEVVDYRINYYEPKRKNVAIKLNYTPRNEVQRKAIESLRDSKYSKNAYQKMLCLNTGDGKTYCAVNYIATSARIPMIFIDKENLANQWKERIIEYSSVTEDQIYYISGKKSIDKLFTMKKIDIKKYKFFIASHKTIKAFMDIDPENIQSLFNKLDISVKIFDEAHLEYEKIFRIDSNTLCPSLYLTATPSRTNRSEDMVFQNIIYSIFKFTSDSNKIKNKGEKYHRVIICKINTKPSEEVVATLAKASMRRGFNVPAYSKYILEDKYDEYYKYIHDILFNITLAKGAINRKTVILIKQKNLVDKIYDSLHEDLIDKYNINITIGKFYSGLSKDLKEQALESDIIVTTDSSMGTAIDIKGLECIISTIPTSSPVLTTQMLGRLRQLDNKEVLYFDIVDCGFKECRNQLTQRKSKVYNLKANRIQEIEL